MTPRPVDFYALVKDAEAAGIGAGPGGCQLWPTCPREPKTYRDRWCPVHKRVMSAMLHEEVPKPPGFWREVGHLLDAVLKDAVLATDPARRSELGGPDDSER